MHPRLDLDGPGALREVDGGGPGAAGEVIVQAPNRGASADLRGGEGPRSTAERRQIVMRVS